MFKTLLLLLGLIGLQISYSQSIDVQPVNNVYDDDLCQIINGDIVFTFTTVYDQNNDGCFDFGSIEPDDGIHAINCFDATSQGGTNFYGSFPYSNFFIKHVGQSGSLITWELRFPLSNLTAPFQDSIFFNIQNNCGVEVFATYVDYQTTSPLPGNIDLVSAGTVIYDVSGQGFEVQSSVDLLSPNFSDNNTVFYADSMDWVNQTNPVSLPHTFTDNIYYTTEDDNSTCTYSTYFNLAPLTFTLDTMVVNAGDPCNCNSTSTPAPCYGGVYEFYVEYTIDNPEAIYFDPYQFFDYSNFNVNNLTNPNIQNPGVYLLGNPNPGDLQYALRLSHNSNEFGRFAFYFVPQSSGISIPLDTLIYEEMEEMVYNITTTNISCYGESDGIIEIDHISGGNIDSIRFQTPGTIFTTTNFTSSFLDHGPYNITLYDGNCFYYATEFVAEPSEIQINLIESSATCNQNDGAAAAIITGGQPPYDTYWSTGVFNQTSISGLSAGLYYLNVTDNSGCQSFQQVEISNSSNIIISGNTFDANCGLNNGAIDLTVVGFSGPFTYEWSNGATTEDLINIGYGAYDVIVTDQNGCQSVASFFIDQSNAISVQPQPSNADCNVANGSVFIAASGGAGIYFYSIFDDQNNQIGNSQTTNNLGAGEYTATVIDANNCEVTETFQISENGAPSIQLQSITTTNCDATGAIDVEINSGTTYTVEWSNGETTEDLTNQNNGIYTITVTDANTCQSSETYEITNQIPTQQEICVVSVDSATNTNLIIWEKPTSTIISHYNIYRESSVAGVYQYIDSVLYADESIYVDSSANPLIRSYRYRITAVSICGEESQLSPIHKTIHLTKNTGIGGEVNLAWNDYEGFGYATVELLRYTDVNGWESIQTMPSTQFTFTDFSPPASAQILDYVIVAVTPNTCSTSLLKAQDYNGTRSNRSAGISNGGDLGLNDEEIDFAIYPNPTKGKITIEADLGFHGASILVMDSRGRVVKEIQNFSGIKRVVDLSSYENGIYNIQIIQNETNKTYRIAKQ